MHLLKFMGQIKILILTLEEEQEKGHHLLI